MSLVFLAILILNFVYIIILPRVFFRADGTFNLMWWVTGFPLGLSPFAVVLHSQGLLPSTIALPLSQYSEVMAGLISVFSYCLISFTLGTHRIPLALWHQNNDAPKQIVTWGAYKRIRHPFYTSFLVALTASLVAAPNLLTLFSLIYGFVILNMTANKEEAKLSTSDFGKEYVDYIKTTGRFVPKI
jgi:protein-S-isoprenylcysteine O-methyltransferase Ste14